jgi:hypothetical protein
VALIPSKGDDPGQYETEPLSLSEKFAAKLMQDIGEAPDYKPVMLKRRANGECVYLGEAGCTIWDRAPHLCRIFDCRLWYQRFSRKDRKRLLAIGELDPAIIKAGRQRLHTLEGK